MHPNPDTVEPKVNRKNPKNVMLKQSRERVDLTARGRPLTARSGKAKSIEKNPKKSSERVDLTARGRPLTARGRP